MSMGGPHTIPLMYPLTLAIASIIPSYKKEIFQE
jgi:hypothetical protein